MTKRISIDQAFAIVVDVQEFFLNELELSTRARIESGTENFIRLMECLKIPTMCTIERPIEKKGELPFKFDGPIFQKDFFDLTKEKEIATHLSSLKTRQIILLGCETDVCILQSCLGLIDLGFEVFVVEDLLFSSSDKVESALLRMREAGATFVTYKTLFHELVQAVESSPKRILKVETPIQNFEFNSASV